MSSVTVVTGGSRGIGAATCRLLAAAGHDVVLGYRAAAEAAEATAEAVRAHGVGCVTVQMDTSVESDVDRLFDAAADLGRVTGLVNNAAITGPVGRLVDLPADQLLRVLEVDVLGYLLCARRAARDMAGRGGAIVNVSSAAATLGSPGEYVHYAGAKAAVGAVPANPKRLPPRSAGYSFPTPRTPQALSSASPVEGRSRTRRFVVVCKEIRLG